MIDINIVNPADLDNRANFQQNTSSFILHVERAHVQVFKLFKFFPWNTDVPISEELLSFLQEQVTSLESETTLTNAQNQLAAELEKEKDFSYDDDVFGDWIDSKNYPLLLMRWILFHCRENYPKQGTIEISLWFDRVKDQR